MTAKNIKARLAEMCTLFEFTYDGKDGNIDPCYSPGKGNEFLLFYNGEEQTVDSVEKAMSTPFIKGKCLNEMYDKITITDC
jgi:hypothetical protein